MIEQIAATTVIYGVFLGLVWKLENFVVKRSDIQISELLNKYNESVIRDDLKKIANERKEISKNGNMAIIFIVISLILAILAQIYPYFIIGVLNFLNITVLTTMASLLILLNYYNLLIDLRKQVIYMEKDIQNTVSLRI